MFTIKLLRYGPQHSDCPMYTEYLVLRYATAVHVRYVEGLKALLQLGDAPSDTTEVSVGPDAEFSVAYIMNEAGRTVETVR